VFEAFRPENQIQFAPAALLSGESYDRHSFQGKYYIFDSLDQVVMIIRDIKSKI
jgi:hypothetical protein